MLKKRYLFLIIITCLLAISTVSAAEISNETNMVANDDSSLIVESVNEDTLSVSLSEKEIKGSPDNGTFTALQKKINKASEGSTINLENNYVYDEGFSYEGIYINKSLTIDGNGYTLDGKNNARIFTINASVTLKNINFINGHNYGHGGAINWLGNDGFILNCQFINNSVRSKSYGDTAGGGAIAWYGYNASIVNSNFINNLAYSKGEDDSLSSGGAIYLTKDNNYINNCSFVNNSAYSYNAYYFTISEGGAIYCCGNNISIINSRFNNCSAKSNFSTEDINHLDVKSFSYGGAIYLVNDNSFIINSSFINCYAKSDTRVSPYSFEATQGSSSFGGAIYGFDNANNLSIDNCNFISNQAQSFTPRAYSYDGYSRSDGGAIAWTGQNAILTNSIFTNNLVNATADPTAYSYGGAIYFSDNNGSVFNCAFVNNSASNGNAIHSYYTQSISINDNWWGSNNPNWVSLIYPFDMPSSFAVLNGTAIPQNITAGSKSKLNYTFYTNGTGDVVYIPIRPIQLSTTGGKLKNKSGYLINSEFSTEFSSNTSNVFNITAKVDNEEIKIKVNVTKSDSIPTNITVDSTSLNLTVSDVATINANLTPYEAGNLSFTSNNEKIATVDANGVVSAKAKGNAIITVSFGGNEDYAPAENRTINVTVSLKDASVSVNNATLDLFVDDTFTIVTTTVPSGLDVTFVADDSGVVSVDDKGVVIALKEGTATITVTVGGNGVYTLNSTTITINVNPKPKENLTISASANPITVGDDAIVVVTGLKDATGEVTVTVGSNIWTGKINNGTVNIIVNDLKENVTANVYYGGDDKYNPASTTVSITVNPNVIIHAPDLTKYYGGSERFIVTVKDKDNKPIVDGEVKIYINGPGYIRITNSSGQVSMDIKLLSGKYDVVTEYNGTKVNSTVTVKDTVIAKDVTKIFRNGTQYQGTFVDSQGNLIRNTDIEININGVFYIRKTNDNGVAQMNINLPPGNYILTATNPLSKEQHTTKVTVLPSIVENYDLTKYYKNASKYTLRIIGDDGKPVGEGVTVKLNINGVFYERKTNATGYMNMNINLPPGTYTVTAEYNGLRASNKITVLSVLETNDLVMKYHDGSQFKAKVLDGQGKPYTGQTVTFNINGVFYTKTTEADGIARLKINLLAGEYIITSMYNGLNAANKVIINNLKSPEEQYKDLLGPHGANGYVYYPDGTYEHFVNDIVVDGTHYVDKSY